MAVLCTAALVAFAAWINARCFRRIISAREYPSQEGYSHPNFVDLLSGALRTKRTANGAGGGASLTSGDGVKVHRALRQEAQRYLASIASCGADVDTVSPNAT